MLAQCYLGELYKRGSLPLPSPLHPRGEAATGGAAVRQGVAGGKTGATGDVGPAGKARVMENVNCAGEVARKVAACGQGLVVPRAEPAATGGAQAVTETPCAGVIWRPGCTLGDASGVVKDGGRSEPWGAAGQDNGPERDGVVRPGPPAPEAARMCNHSCTASGGRMPNGMPLDRDPLHADGFPDSATAARIAKAARWLTGDHRPGLLLYGTVGSGKSTLARAICELIGMLHDSPLRAERLAVARTSAPELVELKAPREARTAADSEELFVRLRNAPMLLVDDLGVEAPAVRAWGNCLTPVIDLLYYRYDRQLFTIVTTNLDDSALEAAYGVRIADRMAEMFDRIGHTGPSYRR